MPLSLSPVAQAAYRFMPMASALVVAATKSEEHRTAKKQNVQRGAKTRGLTVEEETYFILRERMYRNCTPLFVHVH